MLSLIAVKHLQSFQPWTPQQQGLPTLHSHLASENTHLLCIVDTRYKWGQFRDWFLSLPIVFSKIIYAMDVSVPLFLLPPSVCLFIFCVTLCGGQVLPFFKWDLGIELRL